MSKETILTVDDEPSIVKLVADVLKPEGYKVFTANSGEEALEKLRKEDIDLVLLDFFMPEMSGLEVCQEIRNDPKLKNQKIIFLTVASFSKKGMNDLKKFRVDDYIQKPFDYKDLLKRVKKVLAK